MQEQNPKIGPTHYHKTANPFELATGDSANIQAIAEHIEKWIGRPANVFHEMISDKVHIDIHIVEPSKPFPFYTLVTSGMSDVPMNTPENARHLAYAELFLCLPADWKMSQEAWKQERYYWPVRALKFMARFPHKVNTWLSYGHTMPNGNPPKTFNSSTKLCSLILLNPMRIPKDFHQLKVDDAKTIHFFSLVPLYKEEMEEKLKNGAEVIEQRLMASGYSEVLKPNRKNVVAPNGFFSRLFRR